MANIYKRGQTWWARAQRDNQEYRRSLKTGNRSVAEKRLRQWLEELDATRWGERARVAFSAAARAFIVEYLPTIKVSSATRYGISIKWLSDHFGECFLDDIGRKEMTDFVSWRRGLGVSSPTIRRDLACLSSIFTFCDDKEWIEDGANPVPGFMRRMAKRGLKESPPKRRYLTEEQEELLLAHCSERVREAVIVAIDTGLRDQEQSNLQWTQVDFRRGVIDTGEKTKSSKARTVPLPHRSAQILAHLRRTTNSFYVFCHDDGARVQRRNKGLDGAVSRAIIANNAAKTPIPFPTKLGWHDLRRTAACRWLQRDRMSMEEISHLLGHASVQVTEQRYAFLKDEDVAAGIARTKPGTRHSGL